MIREYSKYKPFRFWCQKVLPLVYDDSLSYYELLNKVVDYLNNVIKDVNALGTAFEELDTMVNDYFDNLDVQEEINAKLDSMAEDGTLDAMILPLVGDAVSDWLEDNVTPTGSAVLVDASLTISGAAADAKITGDEISNLKSDISEYSDYLGFQTPNAITSISSGYYTNSGTINTNNNYSHSNVIDVSNTFVVYISGNVTQYTLAQFPAVGVFLNDNDELVSTIYSIVNPRPSPWIIFVPSGATKLYINSDYKKADYPNSVPVGMVCYKVNKEIAFYTDISANKRIKFVAGVIRNSGTGWQFINDANHNPMNLSSVSADSSGRIVLDYGFTAKKVLSLVATPDETFASQYQIGGSVGLSQTLFNIARVHRTIGGMISYNGSAWVTNYSNFTGFSFDTTTGALTISHESMSGYDTKEKFMVSATGRRCNVQLGEVSDTSITLYFLDSSGAVKKTPDTDMRAYVIREFNSKTVNANDVMASDGNFWIFGVMEV